MRGRVLIIAGSDPSGGAGLQADIKTVTAFGSYAATAVTALTVQNTTGVFAVHPVPPAVVRDQIVAVLDDIGADAIKIGMIGERPVAEIVAETISARAASAPIVLDPVLAATSGGALAASDMIPALIESLVPLARLVTPNADEAAALTGFVVDSVAAQRRAAEALIARGARAALVKGGHVAGAEVVDLLLDDRRERIFRHPRIATRAGHGTGCTLASAIAAQLAVGAPLEAATERAILYVREALRTAPGYGAGEGPLNHAHALETRLP